MADIKISQLGAAIAVGDTDLMPIVSGGNTLKATAAQVKEHSIGNTNISSIGDGSVTGAINALNTDKQPKTLATPLTIGGVSKTTVEDALGGLVSENQTLTNVIAPIENGTNYSTTYYKGDEFYRNGRLYKVTASSVNTSTAINTGSGGNADEVPSVVEQMYAMPHTLSTDGAVSVDETGIITASDGYFVIKCSYAAGNYVVGLISGTRIMAVTAHDTNGSMATYPTAALFVRKGTRISATSNTFTEANNIATFYPLV